MWRTFELSANGEKMLLALGHPRPEGGRGPGGGRQPTWVIVPANAPVKAGEGALSFGDVKMRVEPHAEWAQMYHEVWRIERAFFYDPNFHGTNTVADEKKFEPYVESIASRADLNYIFQEMLSAFSVGHLRGNGGQIPDAKKVPGGLLGADYEIKNNRYCIAKIYTGGDFNPREKAPLAQPGLNVKVGDCILDINGQELTAEVDIQEPLEGTAGKVVSLRIADADGKNAARYFGHSDSRARRRCAMSTGSKATRRRWISFPAASWRMSICPTRARADLRISIATTLRRLTSRER